MNSTQAQGLTSWVEVSIAALSHNLSQVRNTVGSEVKIMAVVKADAYGHGTCGAAQAFQEAGADCLGVTTIEEAIELRSSGISVPILIFSPLLPEQVDCALDMDADLTVCDMDSARIISEAAARAGRPARIHVKIDTGMGRLGIFPEEAPSLMRAISELAEIEIAGTYTHLANAGAADLTDARRQLTSFCALTEELRTQGIPTGLCHAANSAAILSLAGSHFDMVRPGTILYGQYPTAHVEKKLDLMETWCLKTRIVALREFAAGTKIGYGSEFTTKRPTVAGVIPIGYAEGFTVIPGSLAGRRLSLVKNVAAKILKTRTSPSVSVHGSRVPVIGRVSMQITSIDVTDIPNVRVGDEVVIPSRRVTTSCRIPRVYVD